MEKLYSVHYEPKRMSDEQEQQEILDTFNEHYGVVPPPYQFINPYFF